MKEAGEKKVSKGVAETLSQENKSWCRSLASGLSKDKSFGGLFFGKQLSPGGSRTFGTKRRGGGSVKGGEGPCVKGGGLEIFSRKERFSRGGATGTKSHWNVRSARVRFLGEKDEMRAE